MATTIIAESTSNIVPSNNISNQQDVTISVLLILSNQLYMFRAIISPIIRSTWMYLQLYLWYTCRQQRRCIINAVNIVKRSWGWAKLSPETCRADLKGSIKPKLLHLVGCLYCCINDARSHKCHSTVRYILHNPSLSNTWFIFWGGGGGGRTSGSNRLHSFFIFGNFEIQIFAWKQVIVRRFRSFPQYFRGNVNSPSN
jgi:hypothetical protein